MTVAGRLIQQQAKLKQSSARSIIRQLDIKPVIKVSTVAPPQPSVDPLPNYPSIHSAAPNLDLAALGKYLPDAELDRRNHFGRHSRFLKQTAADSHTFLLASLLASRMQHPSYDIFT